MKRLIFITLKVFEVSLYVLIIYLGVLLLNKLGAQSIVDIMKDWLINLISIIALLIWIIWFILIFKEWINSNKELTNKIYNKLK